MNAAESRPTKNQKRQEARDKARALRKKQARKSKRSKVLIQSSLAVGVIGVIDVITFCKGPPFLLLKKIQKKKITYIIM